MNHATILKEDKSRQLRKQAFKRLEEIKQQHNTLALEAMKIKALLRKLTK